MFLKCTLPRHGEQHEEPLAASVFDGNIHRLASLKPLCVYSGAERTFKPASTLETCPNNDILTTVGP